MSALTRALRGPIWLMWLGLLFAARAASADTLVRADVDSQGRQQQVVVDQVLSQSRQSLLSPCDRHVDDVDVDEESGDTIAGDARTSQASPAVSSRADPIVRQTHASVPVIDPPVSPARFGFSIRLGPRPPPLAR